MATEVDDDLQLMRASAGLLSDLHVAIEKLLWKQGDKRVHHLVRSRDLDHVIQLVYHAYATDRSMLLIHHTAGTFPGRPSAA